MRIAALVLMACIAGCSLSPSSSECNSDTQCGDDVCARTNECLPRSSVRAFTVRWTINGAPADEAACAGTHLYLQFDGTDYGDTLRFAPVTCLGGAFPVDKLPKRYLQVEIGFEGGASDVSAIDASAAQVQFDLSQ